MPTRAASLTNLFNTGVGASGLPVPDGTIGDSHYVLVSFPTGSTSTLRIRTSSGGYPIGPWVGDDTESAWIGPNNDSSDRGPSGQYDYRTTFVITGADPTTASIAGQYLLDDQLVGIYLNGHSLGITSDGFFTQWTPFQISASTNFFYGTNTLDFVVYNAVSATGLRVEMTGSVATPSNSPAVLIQPTNQSLLVGATAQFSVVAIGASPLSYQWRFNGANLIDNGRIGGTHTATLVISNAQSYDAGSYQVLLTNAYGTAASSVAALSIVIPPSILTPPQDRSVGVGGTAAFMVMAGGTAPFTYQWLKGGSPISGANQSVLSLTNVQAGDAGHYSVIVSNSAGSATSAAAALNLLNYCANAQPAGTIYPMGATVPLGLRTYNCSTQTGVPGSAAVAWISNAGFTRSLPVTTDATGSNILNFRPLATETGIYQVGAALPGQPIPAAQGSFSIVGMSLSSTNLATQLKSPLPQTNLIILSNLTSVSLTGIAASVAGSAPDVQVQLSVPPTLAGAATSQLICVLTAPANASAQDQFNIVITSAQGTTNIIAVTVTVVPQYPQVVVSPASLGGTMVQGGQSFLSFGVTNIGGVASGPVQILIPQAPWLGLVTLATITNLAAGQGCQVTLCLTPAFNLPLGAYGGGLYVVATNGYSTVPFTFDCVSSAQGGLQITVQDQLSYFASDAPNVSNATVTVTDFLTRSNIATVVTGGSGVILFSNLTSAYYTVDISAPDHQIFSETVLVPAGQNTNVTAFLPLDLVESTFTVTPTTIPDHYDITLNTTFQSLVPLPVVTVNPGAIDLCALSGQSNQINLTITNSGLIAAQGLELTFGAHPDWLIQPLATGLGDLGPLTNMVVPVTILRTGSANNVQNQIAAQLAYHVTGATNRLDVTLPIYVFDANPLDCQPQAPTPTYLPVPLLPGNNAIVAVTNSGTGEIIVSSGPSSGGSGPVPGVVAGPSLPSLPGIFFPSYNFPTPQGILVQVKLRIEQSAVIARDAFKATLTLDNNSGSVVSNLAVNIMVYDASNNPANTFFGIPAPTLSGLNAVDGTGRMPLGASGQGVWTIVPATNAAPLAPTPYSIGGSYSFTLNGELITVPIVPVPITVLPTPILSIDYFLQHDVYSDDPFTPQTEPSIPFSLGILVKNVGHGNANDFTITSSQPKIVENLSDLLIMFQIISSQVGSSNVPSPSLTMDLGNIKPASTTEGLWDMTSTLEGQFVAFTASYQHVDDFNNTNVSLISGVNTHELNHVVRITSPADDGLPDFLVNDSTNVDAPPGIVYSSDGTTYPVTSLGISNTVTLGAPSGTNPNVNLTVSGTVPAGWVYLQVVDPGAGNYPVASVRRSDGSNLLVGPNVWQTPMRVHMVPPQNNNLIHLFDYNSTGSYTITYGLPVVAPAAVTAAPVNVVPASATLNALVDPNGAGTQVYFQYGTTTNYGINSASLSLNFSLFSTQSVSIGLEGLRGNTTYHFRVVAANSAGTTYGSDVTFTTTALPPPVITQATNRSIADGSSLSLTNHAMVSTLPLTYSLDPSDPAGATITPNGVFRWTPTCAQGSSTNRIVIWVTDSSNPPLSNSMTFTVAVGECVQLSIGSTVAQTGQIATVPVTLLSTVGLTNLNWVLLNPANRLTNWSFSPTLGVISNATTTVLDPSRTRFTVTTSPGQVLQSPSVLGTIQFTGLQGDSAFLPLQATNVPGTRLDGSTAGNILGGQGRLVLIGPQPLLEADLCSNGTRLLILYGNPGTNYEVFFTTNLVTPNWQVDTSVGMTNMTQQLQADPNLPAVYYRAVQH